MEKLTLLLQLLLCSALAAQEPGPNVLVDNIDFPSDYIVADIDGDGDNDLLTRALNSLSGNRAFLENTGSGAFARPVFFTHYDKLLPLALGDLDGDGDADLAAGLTVGPNTGFFYRNDGANHFLPPGLPPDPVSNLKGMVAVDLDGDGDADLLGWKDNRVFWAANTDGQGAFSGAILAGSPLPGDIQSLAVADMDLNGMPDIVCCAGPPGQEHILAVLYQENPGSWAFEAGLARPAGLAGDDIELSLSDLDGDGFPDVALSGHKPGAGTERTFKIFANLDGIPAGQEAFTLDGVHSFALGDIDGDGDADLAAQYQQSVSWFRNDGNFNWLERAIPGNDVLSPAIRLADMDQDGSLDLVQARGILSPDNGAFFTPNLGQGAGWGARRAIHHELTRVGASVACDWDADGDQDVLWTDTGSPGLYWLENLDGQGHFAGNAALLNLGQGAAWIAPYDLGQDGDTDLLLALGDPDSYTTYYLAVLERNGSAPSGFGPLAIIDTLQRGAMDIGDLDGDGDADILAYHKRFGLSWFEQTPAGYERRPLANADANTSFSTPPGIGDLNGDGFPDAMGYAGQQLTWFLNPDGQGPSAQHALAPPYPFFTAANAADLNGDGRPEMVGPCFDVASQNTYIAIGRYQPASNTFGPLEFTHPVSAGNHRILDVNQDGFPDYCSLDGTFLNLDGQGTFAPAIQPGLDLTMASTGDLNGDGSADFLSGGYNLYWLDSNPFLRPALTGRLALSQGDTCLYGSSAPGIPNWLIRTEDAAGETAYVSTNSDGRFSLALPDTGAYTVSVAPPFSYWETCPADTVLSFPEAGSRDSALFSANATADCPFVTVSVYVSRLRPCLPGFITVNFVNNGTAAAEDVPIEVILDGRLLVTGSDYPWDMATDSSLLFTIPQLGLFESGRIILNVEPDCNLVEAGSLICTTVQTRPDTGCLPPGALWDGSTLEANGYCQGDTTYFELRNVGDGAMSEERQYRIEIVNDDIIVFRIDDMQLGPGQSLSIAVPGDSLALRLVAQQDPNHPLAEDISLVVAGCSFPDSLLAVIAGQFPYSTGDPFRQAYCREVTSSFDPNAKSARPRGIGQDHLIEKGWRLEYTVDFQNTGNDTAFVVVIRDTLSPHLDLSTLRILGGSHPFSWQLRPGRELVFTFENILLPDSAANFEGSMGHVSFQAYPRPGLSPGAVIENTAAIYFDFNAPIITNTVFHTIRKPQVYAVEDAILCQEFSYLGQYWPADTTVVEHIELAAYDSLTTHHIDVLPAITMRVDTILEQGSLLAGLYLEQDTVFTDTIPIQDGCDEYIIYQVTVISSDAEAVARASGLAVYPNPARSEAVADWSRAALKPTAIELYDARGKLLDRYEVKGQGRNCRLELNRLPPGAYLLAFSGEFGRACRLLLVR